MLWRQEVRADLMSTPDVDVMASLSAWDEWLVSAPVKVDTHTAVLRRRLGIA